MSPSQTYEALFLQRRLDYLSLTDPKLHRGHETIPNELESHNVQCSDLRTTDDFIANHGKNRNL